MASGSNNKEKTPQSLVTEDLVRAALKADRGDDAELCSWEVKDFTKPGDNYACFVSSVAIDFRQEGKEQHISYVVKLNPCRNVTFFEKITYSTFNKEGTFYRDFVPLLNQCLQDVGITPLALPRFVHLHLKPGEEILFLEDLRPRGFRMLDRRKGQDVAHAILVVKELAKLHAASVLLQKQDPETSLLERFPLLEDWFCSQENIKDEQFKAMTSSNTKAARAIAERSPGYEHVVSWIDDLQSHYLETLVEQTTATDPRLTVVNHGDCWNNNLLFRYDTDGCPVEVVLLDLQVNRVGDATLDLNYFFYSSFNGSDRKTNLDLFLGAYYTSFKDILEMAEVRVPFTPEDLKKNYFKHNLFGIALAMFLVPIVLVEEQHVVDLSKYDDEIFASAVDDFNKTAEQMANTDPRVQDRFLCIFDDLMEQGIIKTK